MENHCKSFVARLPTKWQTDILALVTKIRDIHALGRMASTSPEQEQPTIYTRIVSAMPTQELTQDWCPVLCMLTACQPQQCLRHVLEGLLRAAQPGTFFQQTNPKPSGAITYSALLHTTLLLLKLAALAGSISSNTPNTVIALSVLWDSISGLWTSIATSVRYCMHAHPMLQIHTTCATPYCISSWHVRCVARLFACKVSCGMDT